MKQKSTLYGLTAALGGALLLTAGWLGRAPNAQPALWLLWVMALLLIAVGSMGLTASLQRRSGVIGRWLLWIALVLLILGGLGAAFQQRFLILGLIFGTILLPMAMLIGGNALWHEEGSTSIALPLLMGGLIAAPAALIVEIAGIVPSLGWQPWTLGVGLSWLALGVVWLLQSEQPAAKVP
ncbi:MAG: hypothetical protein KDD73_06980 [Anaerolineales bacterium]|nr:hypothetical protein [Anaerolineales bacterium]